MNSSKSNVQHRLLLLVCWVSAIFSAFFLEAREHMIYCACLMRNFAKIEWTKERERTSETRINTNGTQRKREFHLCIMGAKERTKMMTVHGIKWKCWFTFFIPLFTVLHSLNACNNKVPETKPNQIKRYQFQLVLARQTKQSTLSIYSFAFCWPRLGLTPELSGSILQRQHYSINWDWYLKKNFVFNIEPKILLMEKESQCKATQCTFIVATVFVAIEEFFDIQSRGTRKLRQCIMIVVRARSAQHGEFVVKVKLFAFHRLASYLIRWHYSVFFPSISKSRLQYMIVC